METNRSIGMCVLVDENNHRCDALPQFRSSSRIIGRSIVIDSFVTRRCSQIIEENESFFHFTKFCKLLKTCFIYMIKKYDWFFFLQTNEQISIYQDPDDKENYSDVIFRINLLVSLLISVLQDNDGCNLLDISGRDPADYARKLLRKLLTFDELTSYILPSRFDDLYLKKPLQKERFDLLNMNSKWLIQNFSILRLGIRKLLRSCYRLSSW